MTVPVGTPAEKTHPETPKPRVSKRLRYEILRRDNHACRYCGAMAPDAKLTIDHVTPVALGGTNDPANLVTACADCNSGKSATPPDAPLVADVEQDAIRWARAMWQAAEIQRRQRAEMDEFTNWFLHAWLIRNDWTPHKSYDAAELATDWKSSIAQFVDAGASAHDLEHALNVAFASQADAANTWRYFCGVMWRMLTERVDLARRVAVGEG